MARVFQSNVGTAGLPTWGSIRSPMFNGSGYRGTYPSNVNWSDLGTFPQKRSAGYPAALADELFRAFPFKPGAGHQSGFPAVTSLSLGCGWYYDAGDIVYKVRLGVSVYDINTPNSEKTELGYFYGTEPHINQSGEGYDTYSLRERCRGGVVNVTVNLVGGGSYTANVTITDDLFPDYLNYEANQYGGLYITQESGASGVPTGFWWTINSLTLP